MSRSRRTPLEHSQQEQRKRDEWSTHRRISDVIDGSARLLARAGEPGYPKHDVAADVAATCLDELAPLLRRYTGRSPLRYGREIDSGYNRDAVAYLFDRQPRRIGAGDDTVMRVVREAFESLVAIAEHEGIIEEEYENTARVEGHALPLGRMHVKWEDTVSEPVRVVDPDGSPPVSVTQGTRGFGKSTSLASEVEDRYAAGRKIVDVADLSELENGVYDAPQHQDDLREAREALGLPADFTECDEYDRPDVEVFVPVTPDLADERIPFKTDSDETVVTPFSVPAAEIPRPVLNNMISHSTDVQQTYLDRAYQSLTDATDDWSLLDLGEAVLQTDAQDGVKRRIWNTLAELQSVGFIRTHDCPYAIDWERIFTDQDTITSFTMSLLDEDAHKYMVMAYLVNRVWRWRDEYHGELPPATAVYRELHNFAPTDNVASEDEREREIQSALVAEFQKMCSEGRHVSMEVLADTQQFIGQINKRVRAHAERVVTFRSQVGSLRPLFKDMIGLDEDRVRYMNTIARDFDTGQAAVLGYTGTNRSLEMPIDWAPPMSHHVDADKGESGWEMRAELLDEEYREVPWDCSLPASLQFSELETDGTDERTKYELFADQYLKEEHESELDSDVVFDVYHEAMHEHGFSADDIKNVLSRKLGKHLEFEADQRGSYPNETTYWENLAFTTAGHRLRKEVQDGGE